MVRGLASNLKYFNIKYWKIVVLNLFIKETRKHSWWNTFLVKLQAKDAPMNIYPVDIYLFKVNARTGWKICSKWTIKTYSSVSNINFEQINTAWVFSIASVNGCLTRIYPRYVLKKLYCIKHVHISMSVDTRSKLNVHKMFMQLSGCQVIIR